MSCTGTTKSGKPCGSHPLKGTARCGRHPADGSDGSRPRDELWSRDGFLEAFESTLMVSRACESIGISRQTAYVERQRNEDFALAWADVESKVTERLEAEAFRRAHDGVKKPVASAGKVVAYEQAYSDSLLMFLLKARRPETYRERVDVAHSGGVEQRVRVDLGKLDTGDLEALERITGKLADADAPAVA